MAIYKKRFEDEISHANSSQSYLSQTKSVRERSDPDNILVLGCGALAGEIQCLIRANNWSHVKTQYLPAKLHNTPERIVNELRDKLNTAKKKFSNIKLINSNKIEQIMQHNWRKEFPVDNNIQVNYVVI